MCCLKREGHTVYFPAAFLQIYCMADGCVCLLKVIRRDDQVDAMRTGIFRECLTYMMEDPHNIPRGIECITSSRHLERAGDHACIMAEKVYFMVEGTRVEIR